MTKKASNINERGPCRLAEIVQYHCVARENVCYPIPRIFRLCPGQAAVEITTVVSMDLETGDVVIPRDLERKLPTGKPWPAVSQT